MKSKILFLLLLSGLAIAGLSGCKDVTTAGVTQITYYPDIVIKGDLITYVAAGSNYTDAGATATENGKAIDVKVSSNVDTSTPGSYSVSYTATNVDGFSKTSKRSVIVYDPKLSTVDLSGTYTANVARGSKKYNGNPVTLTAVKIPGVTGIYQISDWIGGFYAVGYNYGSNYAFKGLMQINGNNQVIELSMSNPWGDPFNSVTGTYDPATGTISYSASWLTYVFVVSMTK